MTTLGHREADGEACSATYVSRDESAIEIDPYEILGVDQDATERQIKRAYRKLSVKYVVWPGRSGSFLELLKLLSCKYEAESALWAPTR